MKTNVLVKFAVVAMAAFGAYAFNGNASSQQPTFIHDGNQCMNIGYACDYGGDFDCVITTKKGDTDAWLDTTCLVVAKHSSETPVDRKNLDL